MFTKVWRHQTSDYDIKLSELKSAYKALEDTISQVYREREGYSDVTDKNLNILQGTLIGHHLIYFN